MPCSDSIKTLPSVKGYSSSGRMALRKSVTGSGHERMINWQARERTSICCGRRNPQPRDQAGPRTLAT